MQYLLTFAFFIGCIQAQSQNISKKIIQLDSKIEAFRDSIHLMSQWVDSLKLIGIQNGLEQMGWPGDSGEIVKHTAMVLSYNEQYEQANWVAHEILSDISDGRSTRTNDFRTDSLVTTDTAVEADYFIHTKTKEGKDEYEGFGYDRGHLAPSADFRWNQKALSESYFYSNMSPEVPDFNRDAWAYLESTIRKYAIDNDVNLFVVTGPVLTADLAKIPKSPNGLAIPKYFFKVVLDTLNNREIAFLMPNASCPNPLETYVVSVDSVEAITGLDFFKNYKPGDAAQLEQKVDWTPWLLEGSDTDVIIMSPEDLGKNQYNTIQAYDFMNSDKKVEICGTVVRTFKSKKNTIFLDLDKEFPNTIFSVTIWSRDVQNFSYPPEVVLKNERICVYGKVKRENKALSMNINSEKQVTLLDKEL